ncbi:3-hydroxyacyl-CoA dehydrogenase, NAD binding domain [Geosmithia morbida]|uniref:3-hydroxyacyl-CoA dehydrogenase, NAD binding domain n=1 Tax=Geosmithia morbida TaxID=1094350 RepID=A0A9P4YQS0_9HYPO|nr:3-hydroxyacyl-CoA dehydrogenase, NAD binding domain [Geosmithia morbida]KAF4120082.1 3-hydroxyacyl-CoA dehydrogenase, NAD binding domain [Geosmithia morbida]
MFGWRSMQAAIGIFEGTTRPLLDMCERSLHFLTQTNRFVFYQVALHYYLGILIVVDAVEVSQGQDLLSQLVDRRLDAEREAFNTIKLGIESQFTLQGPPSQEDQDNGRVHSTVTTFFIAIDPFPHNVTARARLLTNFIGRKYRRGTVQRDTYAGLLSTLSRALIQLPGSTKTVLLARDLPKGVMESVETDQ